MEYAVRPQRDLAVSRLPSEPPALVYQPRADAHPPGLRLDQQQTELGNPLGLLDEEHGADVLPIVLRDPAALPRGVVLTHELLDDFGDLRHELLVPAVCLSVQVAVPLDDPIHVV